MIRIRCLVDNSAQRSSGFWGEHGLSSLIETDDGRVLFDAGQSDAVLMHNLQVFGIDPASIDAVEWMTSGFPGPRISAARSVCRLPGCFTLTQFGLFTQERLRKQTGHQVGAHGVDIFHLLGGFEQVSE